MAATRKARVPVAEQSRLIHRLDLPDDWLLL